MQRQWIVGLAALACAWSASGQHTVLSPDARSVPGGNGPESLLTYLNPTSTTVHLCGSWDFWRDEIPLTRQADRWVLDVATLQLPFGRHEFKFLSDGEWEGGENRLLYVDRDGLLRHPPEAIASATLEALDRIEVVFKPGYRLPPGATFRLEPAVEIVETRRPPVTDSASAWGYTVRSGMAFFTFDPDRYQVRDAVGMTVQLAGNFNGWNPAEGGGRWDLQPTQDRRRWGLRVPVAALRPPVPETDIQFKFVLNGEQWLAPPEDAPNATPDGRGHTNLRFDPDQGAGRVQVLTAQPLDVTTHYTLYLEGEDMVTAWRMVTPGLRLIDTWRTDKQLGVTLDRQRTVTTYRLFAPRARRVDLCFYAGPEYQKGNKNPTPIPPTHRYPMWRDAADGVWELSFLGLDIGAYYAFVVDGPTGDGEGFNPNQPIGDPYARAAAHAENNTLVIDPHATNTWFAGWTDQDWKLPPHEDLVIYEAHVRDLTMHPSSPVPLNVKGTFAGILASLGTGTGLDHLKDIGVNAIEFLPVGEFSNGENRHDWGYATTFFFAPEASYGRDPLKGSQYYEFKHLVNGLHREGFAVILDVVYNHAGSPNVFQAIDRKYYFRLNPDYTYSNYSGVGNDFRSESPMMRRLIIDNVLYWMREFHIDGFRFDLAELIDLDTLMQLRDEARALNPDVLLISEPWSFRGEHKSKLKGTGWAAWNNEFRYASKDFIRGKPNRDTLQPSVFGSITTWAENPLQPVNYLESHDDMALADEISTVPGRDGRMLSPVDAQSNRLGASILFTSLGIPMIAEGQEFLRSKHGISNTYNKGDEVNALDWTDRDRPLAKEALDYYRDLIALRNSPQGQSFRVAERPARNYYRFALPPNEHALGYIVNAPKSRPGSGFLVLLNGGTSQTNFDLTLPEGSWRMIGDGNRVRLDGIPQSAVVPGGTPLTLRVPANTAHIYMDGF